MLYLCFQLSGDRYALKASAVAEVLPLVKLTRIPQAPIAVAGVFDFRGEPVPVIDLCAMTTGRGAAERLSTRIILVNYVIASGEYRLLGLIAEQATEVIRRAPSDFAPSGLSIESAPYLAGVATMEGGLIQAIEIEQLLTRDVQELLFQKPGEVAA